MTSEQRKRPGPPKKPYFLSWDGNVNPLGGDQRSSSVLIECYLDDDPTRLAYLRIKRSKLGRLISQLLDADAALDKARVDPAVAKAARAEMRRYTGARRLPAEIGAEAEEAEGE